MEKQKNRIENSEEENNKAESSTAANDKADNNKIKEKEAEIQKEDPQNTEDPNPSSNRRFLLWTLAGIYLLYTGYSLCKNVLQGAEGASTGFLLAGVVFAVIGAGLLFFSIKSMITEDKLKKVKKAKEAGMRAAAGGELNAGSKGSESVSGEKKSMSIAERANLTSRLEDEETDAEDDNE